MILGVLMYFLPIKCSVWGFINCVLVSWVYHMSGGAKYFVNLINMIMLLLGQLDLINSCFLFPLRKVSATCLPRKCYRSVCLDLNLFTVQIIC